MIRLGFNWWNWTFGFVFDPREAMRTLLICLGPVGIIFDIPERDLRT